MKLTLKKVARQQKLSAKTNNQYTSVGILTEEHGDQWINGFGNPQNQNWKEGDVIDVEVKEGEYNGNKTLNFIMPRVEGGNNNEVMDALRKIFTELQEIKKLITG